MPELSDGDDDADDEEQWMEEGDTERVSVPCLFCDRWDHGTIEKIAQLCITFVLQCIFALLCIWQILLKIFPKLSKSNLMLSRFECGGFPFLLQAAEFSVCHPAALRHWAPG